MNEPLKILLLEDNPDDAEIVSRLLRKTLPEHEILLVADRASYLDALARFTPGIILSDNNLPQFSASEALQIVRERSLFIPFILVTGTVSDEFAANIIKSGADDYILKDRLTRLPVAIEAAIRQKRLEKEKNVAAQKLVESEEKYRTLFFKSPMPKWIYDLETLRFLEVNEAAVNHYGYSVEEFLSMTLRDIRPREDQSLLLSDLNKIPGEPGTRKSNWRHMKKNGEYIIVETAAHSIEYEDRKARIVIINDITERIKAEEALREMEERVLKQKVQEQKKITRAILGAQEKERNYIGRGLHDNVNQVLASSKMYLDIIAAENENARDLAMRSITLIERAIQEIRSLTKIQVAPMKNIDLSESISLLLDVLKESTLIRPTLHYNADNSIIDDELKLNIYRIIQEQISNAIKYSAAKNIIISIETNDEGLHVVFSDDGKGFDPRKQRKGIGINNMLNRVESFNGEMKIDSAPGKGTTTTIKIPL